MQRDGSRRHCCSSPRRWWRWSRFWSRGRGVTAPTVIQGAFLATFDSLRQDGSVLFTDGGGDTLAIHASDLTKVEVYGGRKEWFWKGAGIGFLTVTTVSTIICATAENDPPGQGGEWTGCTTDWSFAEALGVGAFVGLLVGFPVGGAIGAFIRYDKWEPVGRAGFGDAPVRVRLLRGGIHGPLEDTLCGMGTQQVRDLVQELGVVATALRKERGSRRGRKVEGVEEDVLGLVFALDVHGCHMMRSLPP